MTSFYRWSHASDRDDSPSSPAVLAPPMPSKSPRWLLGGLISGAGKLVSSVFRSDSQENSQRSSIYSDDPSEQDDDDDINDKWGNDFNQLQKPDKQLAVADYNEGSHAIVSTNDRKSVIEQLLLQESFSREECDRLTTLIRSRVVDLTCTEDNKDGIQRDNSPVGGLTGSLQAKGQKYLPGSSSSICDFGTFSLVSPLKSCSSEYHDKAVTEAKKYLEERKKQSHLENDTDLGTCRLNTDVLHCGLKEEMGSPVDMAKLYMQSLPPWQSPALGNTFLKSPFSERFHNKTETHNGTSPLFQTHKRKYPITGSYDFLEDSRNIRQRTMAPDSLLHIDGGNGMRLAESSPSLENNMVPLQPKEHGGNIRSHHDLFVPASGLLNLRANNSSEAEGVSLQQDKSTVQSDHVAVAVVLSSSMQIQDQCEPKVAEANNSFHHNKENSAEKNLIRQESSQNGSTNRSSAKRSSEKPEEKSRCHTSTSKAEATSSSTSRSSARKDEKSHEITLAGHVVASVTDEPINSMTKKSTERILADGRAKKQVVRSSNGRFSSSKKLEDKSRSRTSTGKADATNSRTSRSSARKDGKSHEIAQASHVVTSITDEPVKSMTKKSTESMLADGRAKKQVVRSSRRRERLG